jgi:hypothetical protein
LRCDTSVGVRTFSSVTPLPRSPDILAQMEYGCVVHKLGLILISILFAHRPAPTLRSCSFRRWLSFSLHLPLGYHPVSTPFCLHPPSEPQFSASPTPTQHCALSMASSTYATPDAKKEEFRKYLDKSGVVDALTKGALPWPPFSSLSQSLCLPPPSWANVCGRPSHPACYPWTCPRGLPCASFPTPSLSFPPLPHSTPFAPPLEQSW